MSRPRRMSLTTGGTRHKTVTPSPLSQSTSAVHLAIDPPPPHMPRRLSKTRKPFRGLFGGSFDAGHIHKPDVESSLKRGLSLGATVPSSASSTTTDKREKRASFMGRLVKRFSVMRKTDSSRTSMTGSHDHDHHTVSTRPSVDLHPSTVRNTPSPTKPDLRHVKSVDTARQVPPPQVQDEASQSTTTGAAQKDRDSQSVSSIEANYSIGRLTIANPDDPSPTPTSPMNSPTPLPSVSERAIEVDTFRQRHERPQQILEVPMSSSPPSLDSPVDSSPFPVPSRLSTILSADHPESSIAPSPSPPLPDLPPVTPAVAPVPIPIPESPLPPSPQPTRPPSPIEKTSTTYAPSPPASPRTSPSMGTNGRDALSNGMLPSVSSSARLSIPSVPSMEDSPLSRASMIANPPTPHPPAIVIPAPTVSTLPVPQIQPHHSQDSQRSQESTSKKNGSQRVKNSSGSTKIRQTETFRLARSPSGNVHGGGQGFVAEGELWEVIETPTEEKRSRREKSKSKDKEREKDKEQEKDKGKEREREKVSGSGGATTSRRESKKHDRGNTEDDSEHQKGRHRRSVNDRHDHSSSSPTPPTRTSSSETPQRPSNSERRRSSTKDRESRGDSVRSTQTPRSYIDKPQPTPPTITSSGSRREQRMSGSAPTRPSSEFQSMHDVNALKAKEAWDLERLWKGRSMVYGPDGAAFLSTRPTIGSDSRPSTIMSADIHRATSIPSVSDLHRASTMPAPTHGSNHTYFVVQGTSPNMPNGQYPPIIYSPPQSTPDSSGQIPYSRREYPKTHRSFSEHIPFPSPDLSPPRRPLANPLPEPPRLSSYTPSPLPESLVGSTEGTSSPDYWTKYAGVTTTH